MHLPTQTMVAPVSDERRDQRANSQHELLQRREAPSDTRVGDLGLVQRREHCKHSYPHACEESPSVHVMNVLSASLDRASKEEDDATSEDGGAPSYQVCKTPDVDVSAT